MSNMMSHFVSQITESLINYHITKYNCLSVGKSQFLCDEKKWYGASRTSRTKYAAPGCTLTKIEIYQQTGNYT